MSRVDAPVTPSGAQNRMSTEERAQRIQFRRALSLVTMTLVVPGSAQFTSGNRRVGKTAMAVAGLTVLIGVYIGVRGLMDQAWLVDLGSNLRFLAVSRLAMIVLGLGWAALFVDAWRLGRPLELQRQHRLAVVALNGGLAFAVAGTLLYGAHLVKVTHDTLDAISVSDDVVGAHDGRYNVLLLGADAGADRWGMRPDSMTVASIDARTGKTVLVSLPRNMTNFTFPKGSSLAKAFPDGYDCEGCYLNSLETYALDHPGEFKGKHKGIRATMTAIEGVTGLKINYWAMVNLAGFSTLVDAVGGVQLKVRDRIPVGGLGSDVTGYIEPGVRKLDGHDTLWFARAREGSDDYSRMARQKCVMSAMLTQLSPQKVLTHFEGIAKAGSSMVSTSIPTSEFGQFVTLAGKAKNQKIATVSLVPPAINTADPDMAKMHRMVASAIEASLGKTPEGSGKTLKAGKGKKSGTGSGGSRAPESVTGGSLGSRNSGYAANQSEDLNNSC